MMLNSNKIGRLRAGHGFRSGFTLVELLVVIGIIALLIGILMPALSKARQTAQRAACAAKLQQIMVAANIHLVEHKGYYPLVGDLNHTDGYISPDGLNDTYCSHYSYFAWDGLGTVGTNDIRLLAPIIWALGANMGYPKLLSITSNTQNESYGNDTTGVLRNFTCPSQAGSANELPQTCWFYTGSVNSSEGVGFSGSISYIFNEAVLGYDDMYLRLRGQASKVKQPAKTFFAADGLGGSTKSRLNGLYKEANGPPGSPLVSYPNLTMFNNQTVAPITMSDALTKRTFGNHPLAGDPDNFDQIRHHGKMNIAFCDGHVEARDIPPFTLNALTGVPTFKNDPTAASAQKALADVYLLAP